MMRRSFLKVPVVGFFIPTAAAAPAFPFGDLRRDPPDMPAAPPAQRLHQDFQTYSPGLEHYFLGNGDIQAVIQYSPDRSGREPQTCIGLTIMDAERFARKWSTMLFHPERGLERSAVTVQVEKERYQITPEHLVSVGWRYPDGIPTVFVTWRAGNLEVEERFWVPSEGPVLYRQVSITSSFPLPADPTVHIQLVPNVALFDEISASPVNQCVTANGFAFLQLYSLDPGAVASGRYDLSVPARPSAREAGRQVRFVYALSGAPPDRSAETHMRVREEATQYWKEKSDVTTGSDVVDHLFAVSRTCMKAGTSRRGKRDSGIWMYNMEWVRDDLFTALAMLHTGFHREAKTPHSGLSRTDTSSNGEHALGNGNA